MNILPLENRVVVEPLDNSKETNSGIVIPDVAQERPQVGIVLAIGPGKFEHGEFMHTQVEVGQKVLFSKYGGTEVRKEEDSYDIHLVLRDSDIIGIVIDDPKEESNNA